MTKDNSTQRQTLTEYIDQHYQGNNSAFGRAYGLTRSQVAQHLNAKKPIFFISGEFYKKMEIYKRP